MRLRYSLFTVDSKLKKKHPELDELESDLDDDFFERHEKSLLELNIDKAQKKFEKENAKLKEEDQKPQKESVLNERIQQVKEDHKTTVKERKTKKVEVTGRAGMSLAQSSRFKRIHAYSKLRSADVDKILGNIKKLDDKIETNKVSIEDRESNKTVALGTSK